MESFWSGRVKPFEILIYDDASSLRPEAFIPLGIPARVIRSDSNQGPGKGRNRILEEAQGDWIHFHDADDWVLPHWCEIVLKNALGNDLVLTEVISFQNEKLLSPSVIGLSGLASSESLVPFAIQHFILPAAGAFKVDLARKIRGYRESLWQSEDWDFYVRMAGAQPRFKVIPESLAAIEVRKESRSQKRIETLTCVLQSILLLENELPSEFKIHLAEKAAWTGSQLFQLGDKLLARDAFHLAKSLGPARHLNQKKAYRWLANHYGQEIAERIAGTYRKLVPDLFRKKLTA
ncbi:glycosyltransferase family 2 protein [bacterium]|nr:glycosyltransferase family 2 protein [bacterium]